jgi:RimJ/RimL family protein N-acetyltransferase
MISYPEYEPIALSSKIDSGGALDNRNKREVWDWCRQYTLISELEQEAWFKSIHSNPTIKMYSLRRTGLQMGVCGFTSIDKHNRSAEFSLYINANSQGNGYGELGLRTLIKHGFEDWGFKRIWGEVFAGNPAMKIFERVGFTKEGELRSSYWRKGKWINSTIISLLDEEYL